MPESETPLELIPHKLSEEAIAERDRIFDKAALLLELAATHLAAARQKRIPKQKPVGVEVGDVIRAAELLFVPEHERALQGLNDLLESLPYSSCFISHSTEDKRFCDRLRADLKANGVRTWYFPRDARWGRGVWEEIDRWIKLCDKLLVVCSKPSLQSGPVLREIERALQREDDERRQSGRDKHVLFPITIEDYIFTHWQHPRKTDVLANVVGDFRGWKRSPTKYNAAFQKLLKSLQAEDPAGL